MSKKSDLAKRFSNVSNLVLILVLLFLAYRQIPRIYSDLQLESKTSPVFSFLDLMNHPVVYPQEGKKTLFVFWATWCGPCKIELARIQRLIDEKKILAENVVAISFNEDPSLIIQTAKERNYTFRLVQDFDGKSTEYYKVSGTPTLVLLDQNKKIHWVTSGISPSLEARLNAFF
jgi:cytochrome c biogenesis protein CcmG, thiol:disulfide interchange protein DsbE